MYKQILKKFLDILISLLLIIIFFPVLLIVGISIKIDSKGPIFFKQDRVGKGLSIITLCKFRTMTHEERAVSDKPLIGKAPGVTGVGYFLRRYKIDELPQLFSVLKGDLSLVGPRPSIREHLKNMTEEEKQRYSVKPGLTGLAQVSGNIHISWKERYRHDLIYVNNISFLNDLKILLRTARLIVIGEDKFKNNPLRIHTST